MGYINIQKLSCNCKLRQPNETTYIPSHSTYTHPMMSHSHHPQRPRRLSTPTPLALAAQAKEEEEEEEEEEEDEELISSHQHHKTNSESSFSSSSSNFSLHKYSNPTPTLNKNSFGSKSNSSTFSNNPNKSTYSNNIPSGCFNVGSRGGGNWFGGKLIRFTTFSFMATQADISVHVPIPRSVRSRDKKLSGLQKREELEREVSMLHKMLEQEEKVRKVLECVIYRPEGTPVHIPSFLPPKMKELLAELAMVEDEIGRLEKEVSHLQQGLTKEIEISKESEFKQWKLHEKRKDLHVKFTELHDPIKQTNKWAHERMPFEAKALHFLSKAIKGDYVTLKGFNSNGKMNNSGGITTDQKENHVFDEVRFQEKSSNKSGIQKPAAFQRAVSSSPRRPTRQQACKPIEVNTEMSYNLHPKSLSKLSPSEEDNSQKSSQPNKLSESIMKCLIFIFVRLMRTSRAMEIEKLSTVSRSTYPSVGSRRIRGDTGLNASIQKESKQQDPYGIFYIEDSIPRDIGPYKNLVRFTSSSLDPKGLSSSSSIPLLRKLRVLINKLQRVDLTFLTHQQKLAFWINMYNACIMHGFILYGVPSSSEKLLALMNKATLEIGGYKINALGIEHFVLRQSFSSNLKDVYSVKSEEYEKEAATYSIYRLKSFEPNVTFALCCGTRSSPSVRIFTADGVSAELERSKLEYLQASIAVTSTKRLLIPELLLRKMLDFAKDEDSLIKWICHQLPTSGSLRKQMVDCLRGHNSGKISNIADKMPYEAEFQYLLAV